MLRLIHLRQNLHWIIQTDWLDYAADTRETEPPHSHTMVCNHFLSIATFLFKFNAFIDESHSDEQSIVQCVKIFRFKFVNIRLSLKTY